MGSLGWRRKRVAPALLLVTALAVMRGTVARPLQDEATILRLPIWGVEVTIPGYRTWDDYPSSDYGPNFLFAAQASGSCELNVSMFAEKCEEGATPEQCRRGGLYAGNPDVLARRKDVRRVEHQTVPLTYSRFDQVFDDPDDPVTGAFVKAHGTVVQNQLYGYWTRTHYCFELHISALECASFTEEAMPILRSVLIGPDTGATHETVRMAREAGARHNDWRVHAAVARTYTVQEFWDRAIPFYRSALALGGGSIPRADRIDLQAGLGEALIRPEASRAEGIGLLDQALLSSQEIGDAARARIALFSLSWALALTGDTDNACARARALLEPLERKEQKDYVRQIRDSWPCHALHRAECYRALLPALGLKWKEGPWKAQSGGISPKAP